MKIPLSLIKQHIAIEQKSLEDLEEALVSLGIEVDAITGKNLSFSQVVAAKIVQVTVHPHAKNLLLADISQGTRNFRVVCGDRTIKKGEIVAFAPLGAHVQGVLIEEKTLQGEISEGMLVSAEELGLYEEKLAVLRLDSTFSLGESLEKLYDPVLHCSFTPNLGHCQSALGIARELSAYFCLPLQPYSPSIAPAMQDFVIESTEDCSSYSTLTLEHVPSCSSPFWLRSSLQKAGHCPSFLLVDLLHYVTLLTGQPMHAFSLDALIGKVPSIRKIPTDTPLVFLDGTRRVCPKGALGVYAEEKLLALGGIMGSKDSAVEASTRSYLIEAAHFSPTLIRKTSTAMQLRSHSSHLFERGIDPTLGTTALSLVAELLSTIVGKKVACTMQTSTLPPANRQIVCRKSRVEQVLGISMSIQQIEDIFARLDCPTILSGEEELEVIIPHYRNDLQEEIDLIEEIARIEGLSQIESLAPSAPLPPVHQDPFYRFSKKMRYRCLQLGFDECVTPDLISEKWAAVTEETSLRKRDLVKALYAKSEDFAVLRPSLLTSLLHIFSKRACRQDFEIQSFELGKIHTKLGEKIVEEPVLSLITSGKKAPTFWGEEARYHDFFSLKGASEVLLTPFPDISFAPGKHPSLHPYRQADICLAKHPIGVLGEVHPEVLEQFSIKQKTFFAEIHLLPLSSLDHNRAELTPLSPYPSSTRDWTISLPSSYPFSSLQAFLGTMQSPLLESVYLHDLYTEKEKGEKQVTLRFTYRSSTRTLSTSEVEKEHAQLQSSCMQALQDTGSFG
ncbi:MAG: phenylalanine--tRNA ligase subunit beta [Chlamydiota bacterium]